MRRRASALLLLLILAAWAPALPGASASDASIVAHVWEEYNAKVDGGMEPAQALDEVGLERYCCRRMYIGHIDLLEDVATYSAARHR